VPCDEWQHHVQHVLGVLDALVVEPAGHRLAEADQVRMRSAGRQLAGAATQLGHQLVLLDDLGQHLVRLVRRTQVQLSAPFEAAEHVVVALGTLIEYPGHLEEVVLEDQPELGGDHRRPRGEGVNHPGVGHQLRRSARRPLKRERADDRGQTGMLHRLDLHVVQPVQVGDVGPRRHHAVEVEADAGQDRRLSHESPDAGTTTVGVAAPRGRRRPRRRHHVRTR
jgi:hypothetical protein